ncbi:hypothetical protein SERLADRAFT_446905 [Serpula lacrymans var. lacrymans S7.9]|uniref:Peroxisomal membrane protein PEX14 n=1 Tax=Serpula lacrymans var. lacrymans (strain S7.9) TaxID=578457 RepID=F8NPA0_SERL9|nr:uncharacterized protein SERLADRAFT_446905 [Serpula lacrymans var. lacrymans S7.9]EGO27665.1 hypothetical protein SERLADRAFT_446905 [Serpula lacrymans var. lacrymans S7.9]
MSDTPTPLQAPDLSAATLTTPTQQSDRIELISRARSFLTSPNIRDQNILSKRSFLSEKGLTAPEIEALLRELPLQLPLVPPRTYPQPAPSNLPNLLIGLARIFTWITGTSAALLFIYYRFILPRITRTYEARHMLIKHQSSLLSRFTDSLRTLKDTQESSYVELPRKSHPAEDSRYAQHHTLEALLAAIGDGDPESIPDETLLRCALEELTEPKDSGAVSTEKLFHHFEAKVLWLQGEDGAQRQGKLWYTLNTNPVFTSSPPPPPSPPSSSSSSAPKPLPSELLWKYNPPQSNIAPLLPALSKLKTSLQSRSTIPSVASAATQNALQTLSDFTGYITTQTYSLNLPIRGGFGMSTSVGLGAEEDELRREIRALKGLVLNRRSFLGPGIGDSFPTLEKIS